MEEPPGDDQRGPVLSWSLKVLQGVADRAVGFLAHSCAAFVASPTCASCGTSEAETSWGIDMLGWVRGLCADCAGTLPGLDS